MKSIINNKKAYFDFEVLEKIEAGIILTGWEVKSIKAGHMGLSGAYVQEKNGEFFLINSKVPIWKGSAFAKLEDEDRMRKLLLAKSEIIKLSAKAKQAGLTIVPLEVYENDKRLIKILIGLVKGKKKYDKRSKLKARDLQKRVDTDRKYFNI